MNMFAAGAGMLLVEGGGPTAPFAEFGNPVTDPMGWHAVNPVDMAPNFGGVHVTLFTGDGIPCDAQDLQSDPILTFWPPMFWMFEGYLLVLNQRFSDALGAAGVPHTFEHGCGVHSYRYVERDIHEWWEPMFAAFGTPPPETFDHRRATPHFDAWGWTFEADPARAPEFLDVSAASANGVTLKGSGVATVMTRGLFAAGQIVQLADAVESSVVANSLGQIVFHVDLGPAHQFQQYTVPARALEALGRYWTTKTVTFEP